MDIPYKKHTQHTYSMVDNRPLNPLIPCCDEMKNEWFDRLKIWEESGKIYISAGGYNDFLVTDIHFCPWCGEEITIYEQRNAT